MAIGTPVQLTGTVVPASGATSVYTTIADSPAGNAIIVAVAQPTASLLGPTCIDSAGNTYTSTTQVAFAGVTETCVLWYCLNALHLPLGGTITVGDGVSTRRPASAISVSGLALTSALDKDGGGSGGTGVTSPSMATGVLAQADEIVLWLIGITSGNSDTYTPSAGFTALNGLGVLTNELRFDYQIVSSTGSVTVNPTMGTARNAVWNVLTFKMAAVVVNYTLTVSPGAYAVAPTQTALTAQRRLPVTTGAYVYASVGVVLSRNYVLLVAPRGQAVYTVTGNDVALRKALRLAPTTGAYSVASVGVGLARGYRLNVTAGAYTVTGQAVNWLRTYVLAPTTGAHTYTGNAVHLFSWNAVQPDTLPWTPTTPDGLAWSAATSSTSWSTTTPETDPWTPVSTNPSDWN